MVWLWTLIRKLTQTQDVTEMWTNLKKMLDKVTKQGGQYSWSGKYTVQYRTTLNKYRFGFINRASSVWSPELVIRVSFRPNADRRIFTNSDKLTIFLRASCDMQTDRQTDTGLLHNVALWAMSWRDWLPDTWNPMMRYPVEKEDRLGNSISL